MKEDVLAHFDLRCPKCNQGSRIFLERVDHTVPGREYEPLEEAVVED